MPTPTASDHKAGRHQEGTGHSLTQAVQLLPTPQATYAPRSSPGYGPNLHEAVAATDATFGPYAPAIARWEHITGRAAPHPPTRHDAKAANPNYPHASSNGSWGYQTATSPAPTSTSAANANYGCSATASSHNKPR